MATDVPEIGGGHCPDFKRKGGAGAKRLDGRTAWRVVREAMLSAYVNAESLWGGSWKCRWKDVASFGNEWARSYCRL